jgi:hypothetical protein
MRARNRLLLVGLLGATLTAPSRAAITFTQEPGDTSSTVIRMEVTPAAEPAPALAYRFVAEDIDLKPGNAAPYYYRALLNLPGRMEAMRKKYNEEVEIDKWYAGDTNSLPLSKLPLERIRDAVNIGIDPAIRHQLTEAMQRRDCDFELGLSEIRGIELISVLLEEFQRSRELCRVLALRTRLEIAEHRYADAIDTMRMNYRLARDFGSQPFIVSGLIGIAEANMTNHTVLELIAAADSPNLYWALSELPDPLVNMRDAIRMELDFGPRLFPFIHRAETTDRSADEWNRLFTKAFVELRFAGGDMPLFGKGDFFESDAAAGFLATATGLVGYTHAKKQLVAQGLDRERVEKMAVGQVIAIYTERNYQHTADSFEKLWYMPFWESRGRTEQIERKLTDARMLSGAENRELLPMVSLLMPAMQAARSAQVRLERDTAALRLIEALRMHAASNNGNLPRALEEIKQVPVPLNPATGKPFVYRLEGTTAILELPPSDGIPNYSRRFEIQSVKSGE